MRIAAVSLALLLAAPVLAVAQDRARPPPPSTPPPPPVASEPSAPAPATSSRAARPPPPPSATPPAGTATPRPPPPPSGHPPPPGPGPGIPPPVYYPPPPFYWGFDWGFGYYPLYPYYAEPLPGGYAIAPVPAAPPMVATLRLTGAIGESDHGGWGTAFAVDSHGAGFDMSFDAFEPTSGGVMAGAPSGMYEAYGFGSAHFAYPILSGASYRVRLLAGGSWLSVPTSAYGGQADAFGFDLGASANLGLIGPLGLEGHAHYTPFPVQVTDLRAALALRAGPLSLLGGYRWFDVAADSRTGPAARFEGPEFGLGFIF